MNTIEQIEEAMAELLLLPEYGRIVKEYDRLLDIMGNVDGYEIIALAMLAARNVTRAAP